MREAIEELHFHPRWFETQFLPEAFFKQQLEYYRKSNAESDDGWQFLEHHRYRAFRTILSNYTELTDEKIRHYLELCDLDEDQAMASAVRIDLLLWEGLSRQQYQELVHHPAYATPTAQKLVRRNEMRETLMAETVSEELFSLIRSQQDSAIERDLAHHPGLSIEQLAVLADEGQNRAVRNMARNRLGKRFFRNRQISQNDSLDK